MIVSMNKAIQSIQLSRLLPVIRQQFPQVYDKRDPEASALDYPFPDILMAGLAMKWACWAELIATSDETTKWFFYTETNVKG